MNSNSGISEHCFGTSSSNSDLLVGTFNVVRETGDDSELESLGSRVTRDSEHSTSGENFLIDLVESDQSDRGCSKKCWYKPLGY